MKTLLGIEQSDLPAILDAQLPPDAYKAVPGATGLTDIDPGYMRKVLNENFGLCGIGWGYTYDPTDLHTEIEERARASGGKRRVVMANLKKLIFWYAMDNQGQIVKAEVPSSGGSENDVEAYAMSGSITNALGKAVSNIGFQESVYLGKRSHKTAPAPKAATAKSAPAASAATAPAAKPAPAPAAKSAAPAATAPANKPAPAAIQDTSFVIGVGKRAGQSLAAVWAEGAEGQKSIQFYAGMPGGTPVKDQLIQAAKVFLAAQSVPA
jgi:pyruvate/2-oxoglutarate dehydrogenase complex dihydrolipoamide acyltransferase (E2) component